MEKQPKNIPTLSSSDIVRAFETLANPNSPKQLIKSADKYISECEFNPEFSLLLIKIINDLTNAQTKWQILIHLKNVIKRNWTAKRRANQVVMITFGTKQQIKQELLTLYKNNWKLHYKEFNEIFRYLSRQDFPNNYPLLNQFIIEVLSSIAKFSMQQILQSQQLLPYLSLVKVIYKEYAERRMQHSKDNYNKYIAEPVRLAVNILQKINEALQVLKTQQIDHGLGKQLFECSRKIDKIILYSLQSMVTAMQYNPEIIQIIKYQVMKLQMLLQYRSTNWIDQVDLNILAILQLISKLQSFFPLLFSSFLSQYLQLIISLLFNQSFTNEKVINCIIKANVSTLNSFPYYMSKQEFKQSLECKKDSNSEINQKIQLHCHEVWRNIYNSSNVMTLLEKIVGELMVKYQRINQDDEIMFEDAEQADEGVTENGPFELLISLIKAIMHRFKEQSKLFVGKMIQHLTNQPLPQIPKILNNMFEIILLLPKLFEQSEIDIQIIFNLMEKCYATQNFNLFCRLIRNYNNFFKQEIIVKCFDILLGIIDSPNVNHHTIYQSAVCIRKFLVDYQEVQLPLQRVGSCLVKIFNLIQIYKDVPSHLWNLLNLMIQILKALSTETIMANLQYLIHCVDVLTELKDKGSLIIPALAQLLTNILNLIDPDDSNYIYLKIKLYTVSLKLIQNTPLNVQEQTINHAKYQLWLSVIKDINANFCPEELKEKLIRMMSVLKQPILDDEPSLFFEILEEYLLSGVMQITNQDLIKLYLDQIQQEKIDNNARVNMSYFSLYFTYTLLTNAFIPELLRASMDKLIDIMGKVSPSINTIRMELMLIINYHIILYGGQKVFQIFNSAYGNNYKQWFWPYIWSLQYLNNKYSAKVITIALLKSISLLKDVICQKIQENLPVDHILKFITLYTDPIKAQQAINTYAGSIKMFSHSQMNKSNIRSSGERIKPRKARLHVNPAWAELDLSEVYRQQISQLFRQWDWDIDDLQQRYSINIVVKISQLLNPTSASTN